MTDVPDFSDSSLGPTIVGTNRWVRAQKVAEEARERPTGERAEFVDEACGDDDNLRSKVESLLREEHEVDGVFEEAIGDVLYRFDSSSLPQPSQLGKYEIVEKVGQGGFGVVYRGRDPLLRRNVAVKVCSTEDQDLRDRFFREGRIAAGLQHANVTTVHDLGVENDMPFLVQEFLTGSDLEQVIRDQTELDVATKLDYLVQIARGLAYAHEEGVVHRDLKPSNIRLLESGTVKIMDFGIAKLLHEETDLTRTGTAIGTVGYLAPEQLAGNTIDGRADIFSFGVLVYELLSYQRPFQGETFSQVSYRLLYEQPRPLAELWPACPSVVADLVTRCLAKAADDRYGSMREVLAVLEPVAEAAAIDSRQLDPAVVVLPPLAPSARAPVDDNALTTKITVPSSERSKRGVVWGGFAAVVATTVLVGWLVRGSSGPRETDPPASASQSTLEQPTMQRSTVQQSTEQQPTEQQPSAPHSTAERPGDRDPPSVISAASQSAAAEGPPSIDPHSIPTTQGTSTASEPRLSSADGNNRPTSAPPGSGRAETGPSAQGTRSEATLESEQMATTQSVSEPSASELPVVGRPVADSSAADSPVAEPLTAERSVAERSVAERSGTELPDADRPGTQTSVAQQQGDEPSSLADGPSLDSSSPSISEQVKLGDHFSASDPEVVPPKLVSKPTPVYPKRARRHRQEARVVVAVYIDEKGHVIQALIQQSGPLNYGFDDAALSAAKQADFEPATKRTVPGKMWTTLPFVFTLDRSD